MKSCMTSCWEDDRISPWKRQNIIGRALGSALLAFGKVYMDFWSAAGRDRLGADGKETGRKIGERSGKEKGKY